MMIRHYILLAFLFMGTSLYPAVFPVQSRADSIRQALKDARGKERIELLLDLGSYTRLTDANKAIEEAEEALKISRRLGYEELEARSLRRLGYFHSLIEQNGKSLEYYIDALEMERNLHRPLQEAQVLHELGRFYSNQEKYTKALDYFFKALRIQEKQHDIPGSAATMYYIGVMYSERGDYEEALNFYAQSYDMGNQIDDYQYMSMAASESGIIYQNLDSLDLAISYYTRALEAAKKTNSTHAQASILLYLSSVYEDKNLMDQAIELTREQIDIGKSRKNKAIQAQGYENLSKLYLDQDEISKAISSMRQAKSLYQEIGYTASEIIVNIRLARYLLHVNLQESIRLASTSLNQAVDEGMIGERIKALDILTQAYLSQNNYKEAFYAQTKLAALKDNSFNIEQEKQMAAIEARYETDQKEQEITLLQKEQEKAQIIRNTILAGLMLFLIIGLLIYNRQRLKIKKNNTEIENKLLKEKQLKNDLVFKNKQLTTQSLNLVQKNETMKELKENISELNNGNLDENTIRKLRGIEHLVDYSFNLDKDWEDFRLYFEEVHTGFFNKLHELYPDLTPNEYRLSALVKLQLTIKEIATIMGISPDSVKTARYRLRKKLGMETEENLTDFMMAIEKEVSEADEQIN